MESPQRDLICALLERVRLLGLISDAACTDAVSMAHSAAGLPDLFRPAANAPGEGEGRA